MIYVGIDPGKKGYACVLLEDEVQYVPYTEIDSLKYLAEHKAVVAIEKVGATPQMGVVSAFSFGQNYGEWIGFFNGLGVPCQPVHVRTWQKEFAMDNKIKNPKKRALKAAQAIAPDQDFLATPRSSVPNDNMVDAFLLATYAKRRL